MSGTGTGEVDFTPPPTRARRRRRLRNGLVLALTVLAVGYLTTTAVTRMLDACGSAGSGVSEVDGECVGTTDGTYVFHPDLAEVQGKIAAENEWVLAQNRPYVSLALLSPLTWNERSALTGGKILRLLQGSYTGQRRANRSSLAGDPQPLVRLLLANAGSGLRRWSPVVEALAERVGGADHLVAVTGLGVSVEQTREAATRLSELGLPMVGALITANGLDHEHIPGLIRTNAANSDYVEALRLFLENRPHLAEGLLVYDANLPDLYTRTLKESMEDVFGKSGARLKHLPQTFRGASQPSEATPAMFDGITKNICAVHPQLVFYAGRELDLASFVEALRHRVCRAEHLTILTGETGFGPAATSAPALRAANLTGVYAHSTDPERWRRGAPEAPHYPDFHAAFTEHFSAAGLDNGYAVMHHDAVVTAARAVRLAAEQARTKDGLPTPGDVLSQLLNLNNAYQVPAASGRLSFSARTKGNPGGKPVPVLQLPDPVAGPPTTPYETPTG
ncbi:hypothetical protein JOF53_001250 [Crossiella equi]|uniref:ABC transporter substrate-binding protein n=1 Tax=Crossiella equi TaxID=130796 RepID=A0ABS5A707_9PSEU|nr:hypothetical protein [Crossiella equi]MBP2472378.1 hypothetical protein [Crossiella equi]